jgi:eight-cysteine-cluster-containing protein
MSRRALLVLLTCAIACDRPPSPAPASPQPRTSPGGSVEPEEAAPTGESPPPDEDDGGDAERPPVGERMPAVAEDHPLYARVEGEGFANDCKADGDCKVGGCSGEVCSADASVVTTCEVMPMHFPADAACGCVESVCRWWSASGGRLSGGPVSTEPPPIKGDDARAPRVVDCGGRTCKSGQRCMEYYGIAGPSGPLLRSCEWSCADGCPKGTRCVTIADGPGKVCR